MKKVKKIGWMPLLAIILVLASGWGFLVHRTIHQLAVYELPDEPGRFFHQHMEYLVSNAPRPDQRRSQDSLEAPRHFIDLEAFGTGEMLKMPKEWNKAVALYSKDSLEKYGYLPYHIMYMKDRLTESFRKKNKDSILFYATDLGHYIGDAHVPLHTTVNYDGQLSGQPGLHSLWESMIPEILLNGYDLSSKHKATYHKDLQAVVWKAIQHTSTLVPAVLAKEKEVSARFTPEQKYRIQMRRGKESRSYTSEFAKAYAEALGNSVNDQLIASADLLADIWYTAWVDAGKPNMNTLMRADAAGEASWKMEQEAFRKNELLKKGLLISRKQSQGGE